MIKKEEKIAERAYYKFIERGGQHGKDLNDWIEAEKEVNKKSPATRQVKAPAKMAKSPKSKSK